MSYDGGGTAMEYIFGKTPAARQDDVSISVSGNELTITALDANGNADPYGVINITSNESGGTLAGDKAIKYWDHVQRAGFHSAMFSTVTSVDFSDYVKAGGIELTGGTMNWSLNLPKTMRRQLWRIRQRPLHGRRLASV